MRILLINTNQALQPYPVLPIGLCALAGMLKRDGHVVGFLDLCFESHTANAIRARVLSFAPDLVAVGVRNLDNSDLVNFQWFLPDVRRMIDELKSVTRARVVVGGAAVSVMPREVLTYLDCDLGIVGDGEEPFRDVVRRLAENAEADLSRVPGVVLYDGFRWHINPKANVRDYEALGETAIHEWVRVRDYVARGSVYPVQSNRGCAFSCIYCTYTQIEGKKYRTRPASLVVDEIERAIDECGVDYFEFVDSVFNVPESHAKDICRELIRRRVRARFGAAGINPRWLGEELLDLMEESGFGSLDVTVESASEAMLKNLAKGFNREDVFSAADRLARRSMSVLWVFLLGGPGETTETLAESLDFMAECIRPGDSAYITLGLRVYPDTPLAECARREGRIRQESDLLEPTFYLSRELDYASTYRELLSFSRRHPNVVASFDTDHSIIPIGYRVLHWMNAPKPYWRYSPLFNRLKNIFRLPSFLTPDSTWKKPPLMLHTDGYYVHREVLA